MYRKIACKILGFIKNVKFFVNKARTLYTIINVDERCLIVRRLSFHISDFLQNQK